MDHQSKMNELWSFVKSFKEEFAEIEGLNSNYMDIHIDENNNITILPTIEHGMVEAYRY